MILINKKKIYVNRFNVFLNIIKKNQKFIESIGQSRKLKNKLFNIFRNITFYMNINNKYFKEYNNSSPFKFDNFTKMKSELIFFKNYTIRN